MSAHEHDCGCIDHKPRCSIHGRVTSAELLRGATSEELREAADEMEDRAGEYDEALRVGNLSKRNADAKRNAALAAAALSLIAEGRTLNVHGEPINAFEWAWEYFAGEAFDERDAVARRPDLWPEGSEKRAEMLREADEKQAVSDAIRALAGGSP